jgi:EAL domain-containing protein (putative c-di-GMP-specific phosphodiesterase class I)
MTETLSLRYQPIVSATSGRLLAAEALLRAHGEVTAPLRLLERAAEDGTAELLDRSIVERSCTQIAAWDAVGLCLPVHINVSAETAVSSDPQTFVKWLATLVPSRSSVVIEVTETTRVRAIGALVAFVTTCRAAGFEVAIDDFGCGYSTMALLQRVRADIVKIDRRFVAMLEEDAWTRTIVKHLIALAHDLDMRVIGEGIETAEQAAWLRRLGCDELQGYAISYPLTGDEITAWATERMHQPG